jgi:hypothetical protein
VKAELIEAIASNRAMIDAGLETAHEYHNGVLNASPSDEPDK